MTESQKKLSAAEIAVDTIDFIEKAVHQIIQDDAGKESLIDKVVQIVNDHYHDTEYLKERN